MTTIILIENSQFWEPKTAEDAIANLHTWHSIGCPDIGINGLQSYIPRVRIVDWGFLDDRRVHSVEVSIWMPRKVHLGLCFMDSAIVASTTQLERLGLILRFFQVNGWGDYDEAGKTIIL